MFYFSFFAVQWATAVLLPDFHTLERAVEVRFSFLFLS